MSKEDPTNKIDESLFSNDLKNIELLKKDRLRKYHITTNIILMAVFLLIGFYVYNNLETFKMLDKDVCKLCMDKTNSICIPKNNYAGSFHEDINLTSSLDAINNIKIIK